MSSMGEAVLGFGVPMCIVRATRLEGEAVGGGYAGLIGDFYVYRGDLVCVADHREYGQQGEGAACGG